MCGLECVLAYAHAHTHTHTYSHTIPQVIRNLAQQESLAVRRRFGPYIEQLVLLLKVRCACIPVRFAACACLCLCIFVGACIGVLPHVHDIRTNTNIHTRSHVRCTHKHTTTHAACVLTQAPEITAELFVEVLGCLANLYLPEFDFFTLVRKHDLLHFLATYAQPGAGELLQFMVTRANTDRRTQTHTKNAHEHTHMLCT
jgi:hypothetical protein